jgi:hypothetical protein
MNKRKEEQRTWQSSYRFTETGRRKHDRVVESV